MSMFDFNGDGKTSITESMIGASLISNAINVLNDDKEKSTDKNTQPETASRAPKTISDKEWGGVIGWCVRIIIGTAALPVIIWLFSVASRFCDILR